MSLLRHSDSEDIGRKISWSWNPGQSSLKVIDSGTIRKIGYGFLLVFNSNFVPKTHRFWDIGLVSRPIYTVTLKFGLGVTQGHRNRRVSIPTYDFLLTFHSNHGPRTFSDINGDISRKSQIFPTPVYFAPPLKGFLLELGIGAGDQKLEWRGYRDEQEVGRYLQRSGYNTPTWQTEGRGFI